MPWKKPQILRQKAVPMRVINLGMSRTGTTSMCTALEMLGCRQCYHLDYDSDDCAFWTGAMEAKFEGKGTPFGKAEWDHIFSDFDAVSDLPVVLFGPELAAAYPEAKILLTVRDTDSWHRSMLETVCNPVYKTWYHRGPSWFNAREKALCVMSDKCEQIAWNGDFEQYGREFYVQHNEQVRKMRLEQQQQHDDDGQAKERPLGEERFLEWKLGEGWGRLAPFLGVAVPEDKYPSGNNVAEFVKEADAYAAQMWWKLVVPASGWVAAAATSILVASVLARRRI